MPIRVLDPLADFDVTCRLFAKAADYVTLEAGHPPTDATVTKFFQERPPGIADEDGGALGLFVGEDLAGVASFSFGYPQPHDSYIGLMLFDPDRRGAGLGPQLLSEVTALARSRGATRQFVAVLEANPKGRAFWAAQGFELEKTFPAGKDGHIRHRLARRI